MYVTKLLHLITLYTLNVKKMCPKFLNNVKITITTLLTNETVWI